MMTDSLEPTPMAGRRLVTLLSLSAFVLYVLTAAPTAFWLDSSELAAGAFELGIPHPPGHPVFVLLGKLSTFVPIGTIAFRTHILCALLCAMAVGMAGHLAIRLWSRRAWPSAVVLVALMAVSTPFWFHGVRTEVYPLHLVLAAVIIGLALRPTRRGTRGTLAAIGFVTGLALANHHYLTLLMGPGLLVLLMRRHDDRRGLLSGWWHGLLGLVYGLVPYCLMPIRAAALPTVRWGEAQTPAGFFWVLSAQAFQKTAERAQRVSGREAGEHLWAFFEPQLGLPILVLAGLGVLLLVKRRTALAVGLLLLLGLNLASQVVFDFDPSNPDVGGYFLLSVWLLGVLAVGPGAWAAKWASSAARGPRRLVALVVPVVLALAALMVLPISANRANLSDARATDVLADAAYGFVPTDGVLITSYFETIFNLWYRDVAEARRPDVAVVHRLFRTYPGYDDYLRHRYPDLAPALSVPGRGGRLDAAWLVSQAARRSFLFELDPTLQDDLRPLLLPAGLLVWLAPYPPPAGPWTEQLRRADTRFWTRLYEMVDPTQLETAGNLLWNHVHQMILYARQGWLEAAQDRLDRARALAPDDPDLERLAGELGLE